MTELNQYSFTVRIRISHPSIDPDEITRGLGMKPTACGQAGQRRKTPNGTLLDSCWRESYWCADPLDRGDYSIGNALIEDSMTEVLGVLDLKKEFLFKMRSEGARIRASVGAFGGSTFGFELSPDLLGKFSAIGVGFAFESYPCRQEW